MHHRFAAALGLLVFIVPSLAWAAPFAYITNRDADSVSVVDTATQAVVGTIAVGDAPYAVAVDPTGARVYAAGSGADSVSVIDSATRTIVATIAVGDRPVGVAVDPHGARVYVTNFAADSLSVIDAATLGIVATIGVGRSPGGVVVNPGGTRVYIPLRRHESRELARSAQAGLDLGAVADFRGTATTVAGASATVELEQSSTERPDRPWYLRTRFLRPASVARRSQVHRARR
jgi:YVTN family beta-propeller protein